jgi:DNA-binding Lrp family transcriptional regulator
MSADQPRRPSFQFYPDDWLSDIALKRCSLATRGLWVEMLSYMHSGDPYGHLTVGGKPITVPELARMVGASLGEVRKLLNELEGAGVPSKTDDGIYYSWRMVRDERVRQARAAGGCESLKHPNVPRPKASGNSDDKGQVEGPAEGSPLPPSFEGSPSSSSSSSFSKERKKEAASPTAPSPCAEQLQKAWNDLTGLPIPRCVELTPQRRRQADARLRDRGLDGMRQVFTRINELPFCRGDNDRGWVANFEWALKPNNVAKVMEGNYDRRNDTRRPSGRTGAAPAGKYDGIEEV